MLDDQESEIRTGAAIQGAEQYLIAVGNAKH